MTDKAACVASLRGHIRNAVQSKHANHVVQKIIEVMPVALANFAVDELKGFGQEIAQHPFGCILILKQTLMISVCACVFILRALLRVCVCVFLFRKVVIVNTLTISKHDFQKLRVAVDRC